MKKFIILALLMLVPVCAYASVAVEDSDGYVGEATVIDFSTQAVTYDGNKVSVLVNGHKEGVTSNVSSESHLTSAALGYGFVNMVAGVERRIYLANGTKGQMVTLACSAKDVKNIVISKVYGAPAFTMTTTGWTTITFDTALDSITLLWLDDTYGWIIVGNNGCSIT